jgi:hypothetical protein
MTAICSVVLGVFGVSGQEVDVLEVAGCKDRASAAHLRL